MNKKELMSNIGSNIKKYRIKKGWTQEHLAEKVNIGASYITRIENGQKLVSIPVLVSLSKALNVSCDRLLSPESDLSSSIQDIIRLLEGHSPPYIDSIEEIIRVCIKEFRDN